MKMCVGKEHPPTHQSVAVPAVAVGTRVAPAAAWTNTTCCITQPQALAASQQQHQLLQLLAPLPLLLLLLFEPLSLQVLRLPHLQQQQPLPVRHH
jgi:hypothetical protein